MTFYPNALNTPQLNTMFNDESTPCVTQIVYMSDNARMHITMKRLYEAAEALKGIQGQSDVARALNASPQTINNWEARGISKAGLLHAENILGCSANWLLNGTGAMATTALFPGAMKVSAGQGPSRTAIKKVREIKLSAGITGFQVELDPLDHGEWEVPTRWLTKRGYIPEQLIAIEVKGESMEPTLYEGDIVVINTGDTTPVSGETFAVNYEGEALIKRLVREGRQWYLQSDNPAPKFGKRICRDGDCIIIGKIVRLETDRSI